VADRSRDVLGTWLSKQGAAWCAQITFATLDPAAGYRVAPREDLPNATRVADHFHSVRRANTASDGVRRQPLPVTGGLG
jgi:transposase